jgi:hypothetical protein
MKIYKIYTKEYPFSEPDYYVVDQPADAAALFNKHNPMSTICKMELVSDRVINQWAQ